MSDKVLVIGSGAREHALAWKLAQSAHVKQVLVAPGNAGTADSGKISNSAVSISNAPILTQFCKDHNIGLTVVNPITLLTAGIIDDLTAAGVRCFGPTAKAAQLEASKSFAKGFMDRHGIPTARWKSFTNPHEACSFITYAEFPALVVKTSGLTSGRDIYIANDKDEACRAVQQLTQDRTLGAPMETLIVEEHLEGEELSCLGITDGTTLAAMPLVQLLKHQADGDQGSQTQAIGAFCPAAQISETLSKEIKATILQKAIDAMRQEGWQYAGVFGARVMLTGQGPKVLGFKCSFQEPESQVILPLLKNDLYEVTGAAVDGRLCRCLPVCLQDRFAVTVVMSCVGYSDGQEIKGLSIAKGLGLEVFHAGTAMKDGKVVTNGGRVLTVTAVKKDLVSALEEANKGVSAIEFPGAVYRQDEGYQPVAILEQARGDRDSAVPAPAMYGAQPDAARSGNADVCEKLRECAGHFALNTAQYKDPILVCTTNSVGAKIKVAHACNTHRAVGQDLVAVCLNDTWARGAEPLFFMPHLAGGLVDVEVSTAITDGLAAACRKAGCTLLEREIAEMPDVYPKGTYSLSGCTVGVAQKENLLPRPDKMTEGDLVIGISSSGGVHCSSIELISNIMEKYTLQYSSLLPTGHGDQTWGELLLKPPALFSNTLVPALQSGHIRACAPVTGGGLPGSILRVLPESLGIIIDALCWKMPGIFSWLYKEGGLSEQEMAQKFNCGIGAVLIVQKNKAPQILREVQKQEEAWLIGAIVPRRTGSLHVRVRHLSEALKAQN
ncbi:trifunctional purine biosynthetic protein adenosine-3-like isoform X2 [Ascaphus truei]|uniref:trifunctional purine biosynthetic protein adenosine-3-like isoform X2 n=1 Tax=Ascaphus truei TaxID=8439 RepID=UPI003F5A61C5